jgi:hypothetical protein
MYGFVYTCMHDFKQLGHFYRLRADLESSYEGLQLTGKLS